MGPLTLEQDRGMERPPQPDELAEWCEPCGRWHQRRDRPVECDHPSCRTLTDGYHRLCPEHRP